MTFDIGEYVLKGYRFSQAGSVTNVTSPDDRHGAGSSPEEAVLNIDSVIIPAEGGRIRIRADGSEVAVDKGAMSTDLAAAVALKVALAKSEQDYRVREEQDALEAAERAVVEAQAIVDAEAARIAQEPK